MGMTPGDGGHGGQNSAYYNTVPCDWNTHSYLCILLLHLLTHTFVHWVSGFLFAPLLPPPPLLSAHLLLFTSPLYHLSLLMLTHIFSGDCQLSKEKSHVYLVTFVFPCLTLCLSYSWCPIKRKVGSVNYLYPWKVEAWAPCLIQISKTIRGRERTNLFQDIQIIKTNKQTKTQPAFVR